MLVQVEQQTSEWLAMRIGRVTASRVRDVLTTIKKKDSEAAAKRNYRDELVCETLTGLTEENYVNAAMEWGIENEPLARAAYERLYDVTVESGGFAIHPKIDLFGASPDGFVGEDGLIEIKCPNTATHLRWMLQGVIPEEHKAQMYSEMVCAERKWCDFVSYDRRLPKPLRLFVRRLEWDDAQIAEIEQKVEAFLEEVRQVVEQLNNLTA